MISAINGTPVYVTSLKSDNDNMHDSLRYKELDNDKMIDVIKSQEEILRREIAKEDEWFGDSDGDEAGPGTLHPGLYKPQLHNLPEFEDFNKAIAPHVKKYVTSIMSQKFYKDADMNIYVQKSWGVRLKASGEVHEHRHCNSHISLVYYLQTPEGSSSLQFPTENPSDLYSPFMTYGMEDHVNEVDVEAGMLVIFPSTAAHAADNNESKDDRYSISYDLMVTTTEVREFMTLDPKFWKVLDHR